MSEKWKTVEGMRLKFRTFERDEAIWCAASVWIDDAEVGPFAVLRVGELEPGDPLYHAWVDATSRVFSDLLARLSGVAVTTKRARPRYKGERGSTP